MPDKYDIYAGSTTFPRFSDREYTPYEVFRIWADRAGVPGEGQRNVWAVNKVGQHLGLEKDAIVILLAGLDTVSANRVVDQWVRATWDHYSPLYRERVIRLLNSLMMTMRVAGINAPRIKKSFKAFPTYPYKTGTMRIHEIKKMIDTLEEGRDFVLLLTLFTTSIDRVQATRMLVSDFDSKRRLLRPLRTGAATGRDHITITTTLARAFDQYLQKYRPNAKPSEPLFGTKSPTAISSIIHKRLEESGLSIRGEHSYRYKLAKRAIRSPRPDGSVDKILKHAESKIPEDLYTENTLGDDMTADIIENIFLFSI